MKSLSGTWHVFGADSGPKSCGKAVKRRQSFFVCSVWLDRLGWGELLVWLQHRLRDRSTAVQKCEACDVRLTTSLSIHHSTGLWDSILQSGQVNLSPMNGQYVATCGVVETSTPSMNRGSEHVISGPVRKVWSAPSLSDGVSGRERLDRYDADQVILFL